MASPGFALAAVQTHRYDNEYENEEYNGDYDYPTSTLARRPLTSGHSSTDDVGCKGNNVKGENMAAKTKTCTRCKKRRKVEQFYKDKTIKDGLSSWCKGCTKEYDRGYRERKKAAVEA